MSDFKYLLPFERWYTQFTPVIPDFYWNVYSAEQRIKDICCRLAKLIEYTDDINDNTQGFNDRLVELEDLFQKFIESGFEDYYEQEIYKWIENNMPAIMKKAAQMVFFGLTDDGYFCTYIPSSWSDIVFDTGMQYGTPSYGRLILRYEVNGQGVIDNSSPSYGADISYDEIIQELQEAVSELRKVDLSHTADINDIKYTLYTPLEQKPEE